MSEITIRGARLHNLKNVTLTIPKNKLVVFTGVSGSASLPWPSIRCTWRANGSTSSRSAW